MMDDDSLHKMYVQTTDNNILSIPNAISKIKNSTAHIHGATSFARAKTHEERLNAVKSTAARAGIVLTPEGIRAAEELIKKGKDFNTAMSHALAHSIVNLKEDELAGKTFGRFRRMAVAAAIPLALGVGYYAYKKYKEMKKKEQENESGVQNL